MCLAAAREAARTTAELLPDAADLESVFLTRVKSSGTMGIFFGLVTEPVVSSAPRDAGSALSK